MALATRRVVVERMNLLDVVVLATRRTFSQRLHGAHLVLRMTIALMGAPLLAFAQTV